MPTSSRIAERAAPASVWILSAWKDLLLFVGTPLLIIPAVALSRVRLSAEDIGLAVAAFGSQGHHLPGLLRAYGDRELFRRYRVRFIFAPIFILAVCETFAFTRFDGLMAIVLLWGFWHGLAQVYGFMRIYDAKLGATARARARLDLAMCVAWFGGGLLHSSDKLAQIMDVFYKAGGPFIPDALFLAFRGAWDVTTAAVTVAFLIYTMVAWRRGVPCNHLKLFVMTSSFSFWWFAMVYVRQIILGVALFEIFHDVQYLTIVWAYNRARVDKGRPVGALTRFLFHRSTLRVGLYVSLVFVYGYWSLLDRTFTSQMFRLTLYGLVTASGLLHYYYDGFIWKIREPETGAALGVQRHDGRLATFASPGAVTHALRWSLFAGAALWLFTSQMHSRTLPLQQTQAVLALVPDSAMARTKVGDAFRDDGHNEEAIAYYTQALQANPDLPQVHYNLGTALQKSQRFSEAIADYREAVRLMPRYPEAHNNWATALQSLGRPEEALSHFEEALRLRPDYAEAQYNWGSAMEDLKRPDEAVAHYQAAVQLQPDYAEAHYNWAAVLQASNRFDEAGAHYREALRIKPDYAEAHNNLGTMLAEQGQLREAAEHFQQALRLKPDYRAARENLNMAMQLLARESPTVH